MPICKKCGSKTSGSLRDCPDCISNLDPIFYKKLYYIDRLTWKEPNWYVTLGIAGLLTVAFIAFYLLAF